MTCGVATSAVMDLGARAQSLLAEISDAIDDHPSSSDPAHPDASEEGEIPDARVSSAEGASDFAARSEAFEEHRERKLQVHRVQWVISDFIPHP